MPPGTVPALYREVFEVCSRDGAPVCKEVFQCLLEQCEVEKGALKAIWDLTGAPQGISRTNFYKALALIAWTQQGKAPSEKLFENFNGEGRRETRSELIVKKSLLKVLLT